MYTISIFISFYCYYDSFLFHLGFGSRISNFNFVFLLKHNIWWIGLAHLCSFNRILYYFFILISGIFVSQFIIVLFITLAPSNIKSTITYAKQSESSRFVVPFIDPESLFKLIYQRKTEFDSLSFHIDHFVLFVLSVVLWCSGYVFVDMMFALSLFNWQKRFFLLLLLMRAAVSFHTTKCVNNTWILNIFLFRVCAVYLYIKYMEWNEY